MILGIDLGTTNSLVCACKDGKVYQVPNAFGDYLTPSVVSIDDNGEVIVGKPAKERKETHPEKTFSSFKRYMGNNRKFADFTAEELSSFVLRSLKQDAENFLGEEIKDVVISVPAYFNDKARKATKNAGTLAGLNVLRIVNEPSAAALGYLMKSERLADINSHEGFEDSTFLVFDFGGGTLDVSLVEAFDNVIEILSVSGDNLLGGIDFDKCLADEFLKRKGIERQDISDQTYNSILSSAERCKKELTGSNQAKMIVHSAEVNDETEFTEKEMLIVCEDVLKRIAKPINKVLLDTKTMAEELTDVILVGGSSKMTIVQQYLKYLMKGLNIAVYEPDYMIAYGMGVYAGIMERQDCIKDLLLTDVCPFSLGTGVRNYTGKDMLMSFIIHRNSALPISRTETYVPVNENQKEATFDIFQGEEMYTKDNRKIGTLYVKFPEPASTKTQMHLTFTYDINGILLVNLEIPEFNIKKEAVIEDPDNKDKGDSADRVEFLRKFRITSIEDEEDRMIMEWGQKLFTIAPPSLQDDIRNRLGFYEYIKSRDPYQTLKYRKAIKSFFVAIELALSKYSLSNWTFDNSWKDDVDEEIEKVFEDWEENKDNNK